MTVIVFGSAFSLTNIAVTSIPSFWVAAGRSLIALSGLGVFLLLRARPFGFERTLLTAYLLVGLLTGVLPYVLISCGQRFIPSSLGGVLFASTPLLTLLLGVVLFRAPRPRMTMVLGAAIGLSGVGLVVSGSVTLSPEVNKGAAATLCAAASCATGGLFLQRQSILDMVEFAAIQLVPATAILQIIAWNCPSVPSSAITGQTMLALVAFGLIGLTLDVAFRLRLVRHARAQTGSIAVDS